MTFQEMEMEMEMEKTFLLNDLSFFLPQDVIHEILLKLPVKSLMKFRCVSKCFNNLITSPSFVYQHLNHSTFQLNNHLILISSLYHTFNPNENLHSSILFEVKNYSCNFSNDPSRPNVVDMPCRFKSVTVSGSQDNGWRNWLYRHPVPAYILASCNGLLILQMKDMIYIWNPCTKEYKELSPPPLGHHHISFGEGFSGFGYDRVNNRYKILHHESYEMDRLDDNGLAFTFVTEFKVYTLGTDHTWRAICGDNKPYRSLRFGRWNRIGLLVNGALHWIMAPTMLDWYSKKAKARIISFDIEKEEFREIQKPRSVLEKDEDYWDLQELQGCLCMCQVLESSGGIHIWMLKDYAVEDSWTKLFTVVEPNLYLENYFKLLRFCENGEIVMVRDDKSLVVYDPINRRARRVENLEGLRCTSAFYMSYIESLVSVNSGTYTD